MTKLEMEMYLATAVGCSKEENEKFNEVFKALQKLEKEEEIQEMIEDYTKKYYEILGKNGICKKSNEYAKKIDRLELMKNGWIKNG